MWLDWMAGKIGMSKERQSSVNLKRTCSVFSFSISKITDNDFKFMENDKKCRIIK